MIKNFFTKLKLSFIPCKKNNYRPCFLTSKFLLYYAIFLLTLKLIIIPFLFYFPETVFFADLTKISLINFTNNSRQDFGFSNLRENQTLNQAAYLKAKDMLEGGYFDHYSPEGISPWYWLEKSGYSYSLAGENLAIGFFESEQVHQAWMNSYSHKKNILNPAYQEIGMAIVKGDFKGKETTLVVQLFGTQRIILPEEKPADLFVAPSSPSQPISELKISQTEPEEEIIQELLVSRTEEIPFEPVEEILPRVAAGTTFRLFEFMISDYYDWIQKIIYGSLIFIIALLIFTVYCDVFIYKKYTIDYSDITLRAIGFSTLWFVLIYLDKLIILELISGDFMIN